MKELTIAASRPSRMLIGGGLLELAGELAAPLLEGRRALIAAGETAFALYGERLRRALERAGFQTYCCVYPSGERYKTPETLLRIVGALAENGFSRADALFALGGGVTGDMAGLAAALYQRGIPCVLLPTTLLAAVDAAVGGKTAVNLPSGKNQLGVISQPRLILCDTDCLQSLPPELLREGWAEIVKCAFLREGLLQALLLHGDAEEHLEEIVACCAALKADFVAADEHDEGERRLLNFGHSLGHAIERCSGYAWSHGEAVAAGMAIVTRAACAQGFCPSETVAQLESLLRRFALPTRCPFSAEALAAAAYSDKKRRGERLTLVLPRRFGRCEPHEIAFSELRGWIERGL